MTALPHRPNGTGAGARARRAGIAVLLAAFAAGAFVGAARADEPVKGAVTASTDGGYARLVFKFDEQVAAKIRLNWPILVISFQKPVKVAVDRLSAGAPGYISAARIDPDGGAIRIAMARKLTINTTPAAERLFVDLLPEKWSGVMPGLPKEVVEHLAERAREAERLLQRQRAEQKRREVPLIHVKVASEPTFTRFMFDLPDAVNVVSARGAGKFTLTFDHAIKWDLADARAAMPSTLEAIKSERQGESSAVSFVFKGAPAVHTFREDSSFAVDIGHDGAAAKSAAKQHVEPAGAAAAPVLAITPPDTVPAAEQAASDRPAAPAGLPPLINVPAPAAKPAAAAPAAPKPPVAAAKPLRPLQAGIPMLMPTVAGKERSSAKPAVVAVPPATADKAKVAAQAAPESKSTVPPPNPAASVVVGLSQGSDALRLEFPFALPTPAAAFIRADMLWLVFDTQAKIDVTALKTRGANAIRSAVLTHGADGEAILRVHLKRPQLVSLDSDGPAWTVAIGDVVTLPPHPLGIARSVVGRNRANIVIPFEHAKGRARDRRSRHRRPAHRRYRARTGARLRAPARLCRAQSARFRPGRGGAADRRRCRRSRCRRQDHARPAGRPGTVDRRGRRAGLAASLRNMPFDTQIWGFDRKTDFEHRQAELIRAAAGAPPGQRLRARLNLARFYLACGMSAEAKGVIEVALADQNGVADVTGSVLGAVAAVMLQRPEAALKQLNQPQVGNQFDAPVWRAIAYARQGKWVEARAGFKNVESAIAPLPLELQRLAMMAALRSAIEVHDYDTAARLTGEIDSMGVPAALAASFAVLVGRLDQGLGRISDALAKYRTAVASADRPAAAQGRLHEIELRFKLGEMSRKDTITALETLTTVWRGDETESEGLKLLAHLYTEDGRYREAFHVMRAALLAHANSDLTRQIQDEAAKTFDALFLSPEGDGLPPLEALALFYDYRELTPIGQRGDEMIRRLADRLVAVDLLDQAAELLQHQVDHRLQGAARAQVATRLALIYLMNHKPERALKTLKATRAAGLAGELRDQRMLLEARALSDLGRHDLALEIIADIKGHAAIRLRADILWAAKRWRQAAEQIELLYADRWKQFTPLSASERFDILRAAVGYSLADESLSLARFRDRYSPMMAQGPDRRTFEVVSAPIGTANGEFQDVARRVTSLDTLDGFLGDLRTRYPDTPAAKAGAPPQPKKPQSLPAAAKAAPPAKPAAAKPTAAKPAPTKADALPTGSIASVP